MICWSRTSLRAAAATVHDIGACNGLAGSPAGDRPETANANRARGTDRVEPVATGLSVDAAAPRDRELLGPREVEPDAAAGAGPTTAFDAAAGERRTSPNRRSGFLEPAVRECATPGAASSPADGVVAMEGEAAAKPGLPPRTPPMPKAIASPPTLPMNAVGLIAAPAIRSQMTVRQFSASLRSQMRNGASFLSGLRRTKPTANSAAVGVAKSTLSGRGGDHRYGSGALLLVRRTLFNQEPTSRPLQYLETAGGQLVATLGVNDPDGDAVSYRCYRLGGHSNWRCAYRKPHRGDGVVLGGGW